MLLDVPCILQCFAIEGCFCCRSAQHSEINANSAAILPLPLIYTTDVATSGTQKFTVVDGDGRYKELIGFTGISATASIMPKDLGEGYYEDFYSWAGKGDMPDAVFERIKNYKKPE